MKTKLILLSGIAALSLCAQSKASSELLHGRTAEKNDAGVEKSDLNTVQATGQFNILPKMKAFAEKIEPEVSALVRGIKNIQVKVDTINQDLVDGLQAQMNFVRDHLQGDHWERIVQFQKDHEITEIYFRLKEGDTIEAMMVFLSEKERRTYLVNIVGDIPQDQVESIINRFRIRFPAGFSTPTSDAT